MGWESGGEGEEADALCTCYLLFTSSVTVWDLVLTALASLLASAAQWVNLKKKCEKNGRENVGHLSPSNLLTCRIL